MMESAFAERFFDDMAVVDLASKQDEIMDTLSLLQSVPEMGSKSHPESVRAEFGPQVRKLVVSPFVVVCELMGDEGLFFIHGLVRQCAAK